MKINNYTFGLVFFLSSLDDEYDLAVINRFT